MNKLKSAFILVLTLLCIFAFNQSAANAASIKALAMSETKSTDPVIPGKSKQPRTLTNDEKMLVGQWCNLVAYSPYNKGKAVITEIGGGTLKNPGYVDLYVFYGDGTFCQVFFSGYSSSRGVSVIAGYFKITGKMLILTSETESFAPLDKKDKPYNDMIRSDRKNEVITLDKDYLKLGGVMGDYLYKNNTGKSIDFEKAVSDYIPEISQKPADKPKTVTNSFAIEDSAKAIVGKWSTDDYFGDYVSVGGQFVADASYDEYWDFKSNGTFSHATYGSGTIITGLITENGKYSIQGTKLALTNVIQSFQPMGNDKQHKPYKNKRIDDSKADFHFNGYNVLIIEENGVDRIIK